MKKGISESKKTWKIVSIALIAVLAVFAVVLLCMQGKMKKQVNFLINRKDIGNLQEGGIYELGTYCQKKNAAEDDKDSIEWIVLDIDEETNSALLLSKYALESQRFDAVKNQWKYSAIRKWLNEEFFETAFSENEKEKILDTEINNGERADATVDKVFLLSYEEVKETYKKFSDLEIWKCQATPFAGGGSCWWWLRTPGTREDGVYNVSSFGNARDSYFSGYVDGSSHLFVTDCGVRPAVWISLNNTHEVAPEEPGEEIEFQAVTNLWMRELPKDGAKIVAIAEGARVKCIEDAGEWVKVRYQIEDVIYEGWALRRYLGKVDQILTDKSESNK